MPYIPDELKKLSEEGMGLYVDRQQMVKDNFMEFKYTFNAYLKTRFNDLDKRFFEVCVNESQASQMQSKYIDNMMKDLDEAEKKIIERYHPNAALVLNPMHAYRPAGWQPHRTALDDLTPPGCNT